MPSSMELFQLSPQINPMKQHILVMMLELLLSSAPYEKIFTYVCMYAILYEEQIVM